MPPLVHAVLVFLQPYAWYLVFGGVSLLLSHRSQIDAWAEQNPRLAGVMKLLRSLGLDPWLFVQSLSLIVKGRLPVKVTAGSRSVRPPPLAGLTLALVLVLGLSVLGCSRDATPAKTGADAAQVVKSVRAVAPLALRALDEVNAAWIDSVKAPTPADLEVMRATTASLAKSRDILKAGIATEAQVRQVAGQVLRVAELLESSGVKLPPELEPVLEVVDGYLKAGQ
jgi:hypothetical protein